LTVFAAGELSNACQVSTACSPFWIQAWPAGWLSSKEEIQQLRNDPVILGALMRPQPFSWDDIRPKLRGWTASIIEQGRDFGLNDGYCVPIHRANAVPGGFAFLGYKIDMAVQDKRFLQICAIQTYEKLERMVRPPDPEPARLLSFREREVLHWIAAGKTVPVIAEILGLSEHTARDHVKSAMRKLCATTQAHAVARGLRLGELLP